METINIFEKKVSAFKNIRSQEPVTMKIGYLLFSDEVELLVTEYRKDMSKEKKENLPCFTTSGVFKRRDDKSIIEYSGIACIDIDAKDNTDVENFNRLRELVETIPYVAYCGLSCGGKGYFILIPIKHPEKHREHYLSICDDFERCSITVDRSCINVSRPRIVSFDQDAYINENAQVYTREKTEIKGNHKKLTNTGSFKISDKKLQKRLSITKRDVIMNRNYDKIMDILCWIDARKIDITINEPQWYAIGTALADEFGVHGRELFHRVSRHYPKYSRQETDSKFDHCLKQFGYTFGTFIHYAERYGCIVF